MACDCNVSLSNTGTPNCESIANVAKKLYYFNTFAADGTRNGIDTTVTLDQAYLDAKINEADATKRFYPLVDMENVTDEAADSAFEEAPSGTKAFIKEGVRSFVGEFWKQSPTFLGQIKSARCTDISVIYVDADGNIIGSCDDGGDVLYGIRVDKNSWDAKLVKATDATVQKVPLAFDYSQAEKDENLQMILASETDADWLGAKGLLDVNAEYSAISTTGFVAKLTYKYGSKITKNPDVGLVLGDFTLFNVTSSLAVTITSVVEDPNGTYTFVIPAQSSSDVLRLTPSKAGRDYAAVIANTIAIP